MFNELNENDTVGRYNKISTKSLRAFLVIA